MILAPGSSVSRTRRPRPPRCRAASRRRRHRRRRRRRRSSPSPPQQPEQAPRRIRRLPLQSPSRRRRPACRTTRKQSRTGAGGSSRCSPPTSISPSGPDRADGPSSQAASSPGQGESLAAAAVRPAASRHSVRASSAEPNAPAPTTVTSQHPAILLVRSEDGGGRKAGIRERLGRRGEAGSGGLPRELDVGEVRAGLMVRRDARQAPQKRRPAGASRPPRTRPPPAELRQKPIPRGSMERPGATCGFRAVGRPCRSRRRSVGCGRAGPRRLWLRRRSTGRGSRAVVDGWSR
jgi:hypothetical protein